MDADTALGPPAATLASLPPELALRIAALLDPQSLARLARTSSSLHAVARTESLWRTIVLELVDAHGHATDQDEPPPHPGSPSPPPATSTWFEQARFLLSHSHHLGYFASSLPYSSRLVRVCIATPASSPPAPDAPPPQYTIHAAQLIPRNAYDNPFHPIPHQLAPFGSARDALTPAAIVVNQHLNLDHPYSGLSVDILEPAYDTASAPMFDITPQHGACLSRGNSRTREGLAAAALRTHSGADIPRLRLQLDPVTQRVERNSAGAHPDAGGAGGGLHDGLNREALFALFSGRLPRRQWPTLALVGLEEVNTADVPHLRAGRTDPPRNVLRVASGGGGAFRGLAEYLTERAGERPLAQVVEPDRAAAARDDEAFVTGFRLRAKRTPRTPPTAMNHELAQTSASAGAAERWSSTGTPRRRGVGQNGGPAVLWHGREEDPDDRPQVTILRAGEEAEGGFVLRLPGSPPPPPIGLPVGNEVPLPDDSGPHGADGVDGVAADALADAVDAAGEAFFPLKAPARPLSWDDSSPVDEHGEVYASSLEGLWLGTYGGHGLEFVHLSTGFVELPADEGDVTEEEYDSSDSEGMGRRSIYRRVVTATKVTGDPNVPSGQTSWLAILPGSPQRAHPLTATLPTVPRETFQHLSSLDPSSAAYHALNNGAGPDWRAGTARAFGRIALTGFASPSWTGAQVRFLRNEVRVVLRDEADRRRRRRRQGDQEPVEKTVETVDEIHLRWDDLQKVSVFKRVRI
ncbi:hypothetical protein JCM3770_006927 [Rhodotorula araucariae]